MKITFYGHSSFLLNVSNTNILFDPFISGNEKAKHINIDEIKADSKCQPLGHGGSWKFNFGKVKMVNAVHTSSMPDGSYGGNPAGFVITSGDTEIYFAGDTALTLDMELLGQYNEIDVAFLPIGDCFTMGVEDAVIASKLINCDTIIGMHYDTFDLIELKDKQAAKNAFTDAGKELILLPIGDTIEL